jgi:hypothetical protein
MFNVVANNQWDCAVLLMKYSDEESTSIALHRVTGDVKARIYGGVL